MRRAQQGITLIGFIMVLVVFGCVAYIAMRLIPMYTEYFSVVKALKGVSTESGIEMMDERKIRDLLSRHFDISYVESIQPKDVKIKRDQSGLTMSVDYEVRAPLAYNVFLLCHFENTVRTSPGKAGAG